MRRFKGNLLSVGKPLSFETSSSKTHILKLSAQGVSSAIPISVPYAPTDVSANEPGNSQARVSWKAPEKNGGSAITSYILTCSQGFTQVVSGSLTTTIFSGLTNGTTYTFTVQAINVAGASIASSPSNSIMPFTVPGAPTSVSATRGNARAILTWTAPSSNGGSSIIMYRVTSNNNIIRDVSGTLTSIIFSGLTNDTIYNFTVQAINIAGASIASSPSNSVTPIFLLAEVTLVTPSLDTTFPDNRFGSTLEISSDGNVICVTNASTNTNYVFIRIYRYNASNASWNNEKTITTSYANTGEPFEAVALGNWGGSNQMAVSGNGNYIGISNARSSIFGDNAGLVEVYEYNVNTSLWSRNSWLNSILTPNYYGTGSVPTVSNNFWGSSLAFNYNGNVFAVGSYPVGAGNIKIYKQNNSIWTQTSIISNGTSIGSIVSLSGIGNILIASFVPSYISTFIENQTNEWSIFPSPSPSIIDMGTGNGVPFARLSKDGTTFIAGLSRYIGPLGSSQGIFRVYRFINNSWSPIGPQVIGPSAPSNFGGKVAISESGNIILVGANRVNNFTGIVYGYRYNSIANNWDSIFNINGQAQDEQFSSVLAMTSDATKLVFGVPSVGSGSVRIYNVAYDSSVIP